MDDMPLIDAAISTRDYLLSSAYRGGKSETSCLGQPIKAILCGRG